LPLLERLGPIEPILFSSAPLTLKEQIELFGKIPRVDLFWSVHINVPWLPIRAKARLVTIHDVLHLSAEGTLRGIDKLGAQWMTRAALRLADQIITVSNFSKAEIEKVVRRPIHVIPHGVDSALFAPEGPVEALKKPYILYVGSFKAHKNLKGVAAAFALLTREHPALQCVVVGTGHGMRCAQDVKQLYNAFPEIQGKFHCVGHVPDEGLPHFYRNAELFLFPSFYEGFGLPPLEAMSCGCPTIVSETGALPEVCKEAALYVDPHDPADIARRCDALLRDDALRQDLVSRGLANSRLFSWKQSAEAHYTIINATISPSL
jgi:glycosyltransferase involved in cell wall biosynthesis